MSSVSAFDRAAAVAGLLPDLDRPYVHAFCEGGRLWDALVALEDQPAAWDAIETLSAEDLRSIAFYAVASRRAWGY